LALPQKASFTFRSKTKPFPTQPPPCGRNKPQLTLKNRAISRNTFALRLNSEPQLTLINRAVSGKTAALR
jgi:hypothetical protein